MSFATNVKNEISSFSGTKTEKIALLSGFIRNNGNIDKDYISLISENGTVARKIYSLLKEIYDINAVIEHKKTNNYIRNNVYIINIKDKVDVICSDLSIYKNDNYNLIPGEYITSGEEEVRAYLLGAFLSKGSVNDPKTSRYHLEFLIEKKEEAFFINELLNQFELNSKVLNRDKGYMVYIKEAEKIGDFLRIIYASNAVMYYEDIRIYRDHKNMTNRLNNCEQANIDKVIETANSQIEDIKYLKENDAYDLLDDKTKQACEYREKYPDASLQELSEIISYETRKDITKSGLNHRFRKVKGLVTKLKENN